MAAICRNGNIVACVSGSQVGVCSLGDTERQIYRCEKLPQASKEEKDKLEQSGKTTQSDQSGKSKEDTQDDRSEDQGSDRVLVADISHTGDYFAACDDHKQLTLWRTGPVWHRLSIRPLARRCVSLTFTYADDQVIVADKSGDVYSFSTLKPEEPGKLLMGHLSMLLDIFISTDDKFLVTCDRDEKIRTSCFPNCYNIQTFCLGHTMFVSCLGHLEEDIIVSGSGDSTLRLWNYRTGKQLCQVNCRHHMSAEKSTDIQSGDEAGNQHLDVRCLACNQKQHIIAVAFDKYSTILLYHWQVNGQDVSLVFLQKVALCGPVWDMCFDDRGLLWTLQASPVSPMQVFECSQTDVDPSKVQVHPASDEKVTSLTAVFNQDWDFFCDSLDVETVFPMLHKSKIDNMKEYMERKRQRLEEGNKSKKCAGAQQEAPGSCEDLPQDEKSPSKRVKIE